MKKVAVAERWSFVERWLCRFDCSFPFFSRRHRENTLPTRGEQGAVWIPCPRPPGRGNSSYILGVKNEVLVALRVFSLKRSKAGALRCLLRY